jgi:TM2 domain-containing membrane protein YozV
MGEGILLGILTGIILGGVLSIIGWIVETKRPTS